MREDEAGRTRVPWRSSPILSRLVGAGAHLSGAVLLAAGVANSLAARRDRTTDRKRDADGKDGGNGRDRDRDKLKDQDQKDARDDRQGRREDREADRERKDRDVEREQSDDASRDRNRNRDEEGANDTGSDGGAEQNNRNNRNRDDEPDAADNDGGGGNSNAGSGLFDNPLATKARRRAKDFDQRDRGGEEEADGIVVDVDPEGESIYETESVSYATGPDGIEILTRNISFTAVPTPTPTPFPRLELPERDGYPFGEDFPFGVARPTQTPNAEPADPGDAPPDPGDTPPPADPLPTTPPTDDGADGGDNSTGFAS